MSSAPVVKKRKRAEDGTEHEGPARQRRRLPGHHLQSADAVKHALLAQYYPKIQTLRQYLLDNLPPTSRIRRRKIEACEAHASENQDTVRVQLANLLDTTLLGLHICPEEIAKTHSKSRLQQWIGYSQKDDSHVTISNGDASAIHFQSKVGLLTHETWATDADRVGQIVDFIIWLSLSRTKAPNNRPNHLLCDGYRKSTRPGQHGALSSIQGVYSLHFNERVAAVKQSPWPQLLLLLGNSGENIMINMLLDCAIFLPIDAGQGNYYQLSGELCFPSATHKVAHTIDLFIGTPIYECEPLVPQAASASLKTSGPFERRPAEIVFVRNRMLYARAALNTRGLVHFGLRHIRKLPPSQFFRT